VADIVEMEHLVLMLLLWILCKHHWWYGPGKQHTKTDVLSQRGGHERAVHAAGSPRCQARTSAPNPRSVLASAHAQWILAPCPSTMRLWMPCPTPTHPAPVASSLASRAPPMHGR
jgi:hypothetical protein